MDHAVLEPLARTTIRHQPPAPRVDEARPLASDAAEDTVLQSLARVRASASHGEFQQARELCAALLADQQPLISRRPELLRETFTALILAQGSRMLSRLAMAARGQEVRIVAHGPGGAPRATLSRRVEHGRSIFIFTAGNGDGLPPNEEQARLWAEMIARGTGDAWRDVRETITGRPKWDGQPIWP